LRRNYVLFLTLMWSAGARGLGQAGHTRIRSYGVDLTSSADKKHVVTVENSDFG